MKLMKWVFIPLLMILAVGLLSCENKEADVKEDEPAKIYNYPCSEDVLSLDPGNFKSLSEEAIITEIFDTLVALDSDENVVPAIAESWEYDSESETYTFHLREGIQFHNGETVTADDVKASFSRLVDRESGKGKTDWVMWIAGTSAYSKGEAEEISGLKVIDRFTLEIELFDVYTPFIKYLTSTTASIMPESLVERSSGSEDFTPVGSGPFKFKSRSEEMVELIANENYFQEKPKLDGINFKVIKEPARVIEEYRQGNLHHTWVFPELAEKLINDDTIPGQIQTYPVNALYCYVFNLDKTSKFGGSKENKRLLRQAINYAIDREAICRDVFKGRCIPNGSVIPKGICGYNNPLANTMGYQRDLNKARDLLDQAGYPDGEGVPKVSLFTTYESPNIEIAEIFKSNLSEIGLNVEIVAKDKENYLKAVREGDPALFSYEWYLRNPDLDDFLSLFHTDNAKGGENFARMTRDYIDSIIVDSRQAENAEDRDRIFMEFERQISFDAPWVFMFQLKNAILIRPEVDGLLDQLGPYAYRESITSVRMKNVDLKEAPEPNTD